MLENEFEKLYLKFRYNYCKNLFSEVNESLNPTEAYCLEAIFLLDRPTVREFAEYIHISQPNATYRINNLIKKGCIRKVLSPDDKREYHLEVTDKFLKAYGANASFNAQLMKGIREKFSKEEIELLENMLHKIVEEIMI
ncbi:MAG: MarR family transcriptional regulator [Lachnospiraceae bacterium]|nr:MarR family transcriptional regulator [Lachnospiraceae bacterium]